MARKEEVAIDTVIETLYALDVEGYKLINLDEKVLRDEAMKRINRTVSRLDTGKRKLLDKTHYRLDLFEKFRHLPAKQREEVIQLAKDRHITLEEAYMLASKA